MKTITLNDIEAAALNNIIDFQVIRNNNSIKRCQDDDEFEYAHILEDMNKVLQSIKERLNAL